MTLFNIPRVARNQSNYPDRLIMNMYNDSRCVFRKGFGVLDKTPKDICNTLKFVRSAYDKITPIQVYYMEVIWEKESEEDTVVKFASQVGEFLYFNGFVCYICVIEVKNTYVVGIALNSVSYIDGHLFKDNNASNYELFSILCGMLPENTQMTATENTFFDPQIGEGNYVHGIFV